MICIGGFFIIKTRGGNGMKTVKDVLHALDEMTGGRVVKSLSDITRGEHPLLS